MNYNTDIHIDTDVIKIDDAIVELPNRDEAKEAIEELKQQKQIMDMFPDMKTRMAQAYTQDIIKELKIAGKYDDDTLEAMRSLIVQFPPQELEILLSDLIKRNEVA